MAVEPRSHTVPGIETYDGATFNGDLKGFEEAKDVTEVTPKTLPSAPKQSAHHGL